MVHRQTNALQRRDFDPFGSFPPYISPEKMEVKLKDPAFWYSLHGQVPGMLEWDMGNEFYLPCTTDQCSFAEQSLAKYKIQLTKPPTLPQEKKPNSDDDGPASEPNLWMWVNPNIVCPVTHNTAPNPSLTVPPSAPCPKTDEFDCLGTNTVVHHTEQCQQQNLPVIPGGPNFVEGKSEEEECESSNKNTKKHKLSHGPDHKRESWPRPPLNYSHLVALALKNSPSCGFSVQQIYNFIRQYFPYFKTAPEGWKSTIRHNLCSLICFEKMPLRPEDYVPGKAPTLFWKLTNEGHRFFQEETRVLACVRKESIKLCMRQPELMDLLFHL